MTFYCGVGGWFDLAEAVWLIGSRAGAEREPSGSRGLGLGDVFSF